ncbi:MAG: MBOAT family O-acyltransferase [Chitinophagales bacterium]
MIFNSFNFLVFLPLVVWFYFLIPYKWRWVFLLCASYYFYMCWKAEYAFLILFTTSVDYFCANKMVQFDDKRKRKPYLLISLISNLGILFLFKYLNFFTDSARALFESADIFGDDPVFKLLLPVGISFYTFQTLSHSIDVYRGNIKPEKHFGYFALFISYWPQLVAGPIERPNHLIPQLKQNHDFDYNRAKDGLVRILFGFFKKSVIADRLSVFVTAVYGTSDGHGGWTTPPLEHGGFAVILGTWLFAIQVYCDFSGYCDIAIGSAKIMGHDLTDNFRTPYFSKSIREFWERWHITLTVWVRDYLYIPLGGSRVSFSRMLFNNWFTLAVMGLWHGANWTYVLFGVIHGWYIVMSRVWDRYLPKANLQHIMPRAKMLIAVLSMFWIFNLTCIPDIFFRSENVQAAGHTISHIFTMPNTTHALIYDSAGKGAVPSVVEFWVVLVFIVILLYQDYITYIRKDETIDVRVRRQPMLIRWSYYIILVVFVAWFAVITNSAFIYFQF